MQCRSSRNREVFDFLSSSAEVRMGFWKPGPESSQVVLEITPSGGLMIGTDSHTPTPAAWAWPRSASAERTRWT